MAIKNLCPVSQSILITHQIRQHANTKTDINTQLKADVLGVDLDR